MCPIPLCFPKTNGVSGMELEIHRLVEKADEPKTAKEQQGSLPVGGVPGTVRNMDTRDVAWWRGRGGLLHVCGRRSWPVCSIR